MGLIRFYVLSRVDVSSEDLGYTDYWAMRKACRYNALESGYAPAMSSSACRLLMKRFSSLYDFRDLAESMWRPGGAASGHPVVLGSAEQEAKRFLQRKLMAKGVDEWSRPPPPGVAGERLSDLLRQHQRQGREVVGHGRLPMRDPDYLAPGRGWVAPVGPSTGCRMICRCSVWCPPSCGGPFTPSTGERGGEGVSTSPPLMKVWLFCGVWRVGEW